MKLAPILAVGTILLVVAILALGVAGGYATEPCRGQLVTASWYGANPAAAPPQGCPSRGGNGW